LVFDFIRNHLEKGGTKRIDLRKTWQRENEGNLAHLMKA